MRTRVAAVDLMLLTCVVMWALNLTVGKYVLQHGFKPLAFSVTRYGAAALIFAAGTLALERTLRIPGARDRLLVGGAIAALVVNQVCFVYALSFTTATTVGLVLGSTPIFAAIFAAGFGLERMTSKVAIAAVASFGGVGLVAAGGEGGLSELSGDLKGVLIGTGAAATWALYSVAIAPLMRRHSPYRLSAVVLVCAWVPLAALGARQTAAQEWDFGVLVWLGVAFAVLGPLVITTVLWFVALDRIGPSRATLFANLTPFLAVIFALLLLDETVTMMQVAGGFAIAIGIVLSRGPAVPAPPAE